MSTIVVIMYKIFIIFFAIIQLNGRRDHNRHHSSDDEERVNSNFTAIFAPKITLNNGHKIPAIVFGTFPMKNNRRTLDVLMDAVEVGYRSFDTAFQYENEMVVGLAVRTLIALGVITRDEFVVTTKIWNQYHSRELAQKQTKLSLKNLGLDYVDVLLMHYPTGYAYVESAPVTKQWFPRYPNGTVIPSSWKKDDWIDTWRGMEDMVEQGLAKSIGVSNFNEQQIDKLLGIAKIKPVMNQIEINVFYNQKTLVDHCLRVGVLPVAYAPIHPDIAGDPIMKEMANSHRVTPNQIALRWLIQRGVVVTAKTSHKKYMFENLNVFNFTLNEIQMNEINKFKTKAKKIDEPDARTHPDYPFHGQQSDTKYDIP